VSLAAACDLGVLAMKPEGMAVFPNRIFDYFAAGLPVVSTVVAELAEYIDDHDAGVTLDEPDGTALADEVVKLLTDKPKPSSHPRDHRPAWVDEFDLSKIRVQLGELIESLA
jgi:glycosyltransferase involved in cell wall biosynthesis